MCKDLCMYIAQVFNFCLYMKSGQYKTNGEVWLYPSVVSAWHFVSLSKNDSEEIKDKYGKKRRGFGSIRVEATVGNTKWKTSVFPDKKHGEYILPLKVEVRRKEDIFAGEKISFL